MVAFRPTWIHVLFGWFVKAADGRSVDADEDWKDACLIHSHCEQHKNWQNILPVLKNDGFIQ